MKTLESRNHGRFRGEELSTGVAVVSKRELMAPLFARRVDADVHVQIWGRQNPEMLPKHATPGRAVAEVDFFQYTTLDFPAGIKQFLDVDPGDAVTDLLRHLLDGQEAAVIVEGVSWVVEGLDRAFAEPALVVDVRSGGS